MSEFGLEFGIEEVFDLFRASVEVSFAQYEVLREVRFPQAVGTNQMPCVLAAEIGQPEFRTDSMQPTTTAQRPDGPARTPACEQRRRSCRARCSSGRRGSGFFQAVQPTEHIFTGDP